MLHKTDSGTPCALISNIQHYTIHDGPGIRTAIFFTGCTMSCIWCSNPETIKPYERLGIYPARCISQQKCGTCIKTCKQKGQPIKFDTNGILTALHMTETCTNCFTCAQNCPPRAIKLWGEKMTLPELMKVIESDRSFYDKSGGGVTLNGGEVMMQWAFAEMLLKTCKESGINTCVETALHCPQEHMEAVYQYTDLVIADIKHMDTDAHKRYTGVGNERILSNLIQTIKLGKNLVIRTPVIPGYNDDEQNIRATAEFIKNKLKSEIIAWQLLPFKKLGTEKYESLMLKYPMEDYTSPERTQWEHKLIELAAMIKADYGLPVENGTGKKLNIVL
ncbi:MAG: glycyl-radical enzyme activating protein [Oscillospiraceae bacterium]|nr:glycyl-radical enzyme activating protein [Oscillospiraceae bacterium]